MRNQAKVFPYVYGRDIFAIFDTSKGHLEVGSSNWFKAGKFLEGNVRVAISEMKISFHNLNVSDTSNFQLKFPNRSNFSRR